MACEDWHILQLTLAGSRTGRHCSRWWCSLRDAIGFSNNVGFSPFDCGFSHGAVTRGLSRVPSTAGFPVDRKSCGIECHLVNLVVFPYITHKFYIVSLNSAYKWSSINRSIFFSFLFCCCFFFCSSLLVIKRMLRLAQLVRVFLSVPLVVWWLVWDDSNFGVGGVWVGCPSSPSTSHRNNACCSGLVNCQAPPRDLSSDTTVSSPPGSPPTPRFRNDRRLAKVVSVFSHSRSRAFKMNDVMAYSLFVQCFHLF